ncbi:MAG: hypothetical protein R3F38_14300 [Gammaproteobacteria bacterium]
MRRPFNLIAIALATFWLAACSSNPSIESDMGIDGAPDWVNEGTQAVSDDDGRLIYGVGSAPVLNDVALQTAAADSRARAEVARVVSTFIDSTVSDYSASAGGDSKAALNIEQNIKATTQTALNGAKIKGRWRDPETGTVYSFAEMDIKALNEAIAAAGKLSDSFKQFYTQKANANFDRFVKEAK